MARPKKNIDLVPTIEPKIEQTIEVINEVQALTPTI
jgi:hypothetical protein